MTNEPIRESSPIPHLLMIAPNIRSYDMGTPAYTKSTAKQAEDPKLLGLVPICDSLDLVTLRTYLVHHAHLASTLPDGSRTLSVPGHPAEDANMIPNPAATAQAKEDIPFVNKWISP